VPYSSISGTPTIPTNNNQLSNGAAYITSSALTGYATESYVTGRGYITSSALTGLATESYVTGRGYITTSALTGYALTAAIPTNNNQLTNGSNYITSSALTGYATESYVTGRGYITSAALSGYALTSAIPTDISQLADSQGLLGQGGGGTVIRNVENPFSFSVAGDDSTQRIISNGENIKFTGASGITITTDAEGNITITGTTVNLTGYATESYVTSRGYITGLSWDQLTNKPNLAGTYSWSIAGDDSTLREISAGESVKFVGAGGITTASDAEGNITITGPSLTGLATETFVTTQGYITSSALTGLATESYVTSRGYITGLSWNQLTDKPNLAGTYSWSIAADDSTQLEISAGNLVKIKGAGGITTASNADGQITITGPDLSSYATQSYVNSAMSSAGITISETAPTGLLNGALWYNSSALELYVLYQNQWVAASSSSSASGDYNDLTNRPTNVSQFSNDAGYVNMDQVYAAILEMGSTAF
jgi:hypothetical protein